VRRDVLDPKVAVGRFLEHGVAEFSRQKHKGPLPVADLFEIFLHQEIALPPGVHKVPLGGLGVGQGALPDPQRAGADTTGLITACVQPWASMMACNLRPLPAAT
jgi:hypothetical protein